MTDNKLFRFGLLVDKTVSKDKINIRVTTNNGGIPDAEVLLIVEAWLETVRENLKKPLKENMKFFKKDGSKYPICVSFFSLSLSLSTYHQHHNLKHLFSF